jgi:catechol 2,3-dioxygenase-like lactoylglutathione lyase family enzyme
MTNFRQITPFMHVPDLDEALAFFNDVLGFKTYVYQGGYAYIHRETVGFRLLHAGSEAPKGDGRYAYYIDVKDVNAIHTELKPKLDTLPRGHVHGPVDMDYGQRELAVRAPDGNMIVFGQGIDTEPEKEC